MHLTSRTRPFLFDDTALDAAIYAGPAGWPGTESRFLMRETLIVVGHPSLAAKGPLAPARIAELGGLMIAVNFGTPIMPRFDTQKVPPVYSLG